MYSDGSIAIVNLERRGEKAGFQGRETAIASRCTHVVSVGSWPWYKATLAHSDAVVSTSARYTDRTEETQGIQRVA